LRAWWCCLLLLAVSFNWCINRLLLSSRSIAL
jgi:hypothetical protein